MNFIEHIVEPNKLLLTWQSSHNKHRMRRIIGFLEKEKGIINLNYTYDTDEFNEAVKLGFDGYPAFPIDQTEKKQYKNVLSIFLKRIPPRSRGDFERYLESIRIKADAVISDFALLGYSGAKLPEDNFLIIHPFEDTNYCEVLTAIAGFRHYSEGMELFRWNRLSIGDKVNIIKEPNNKFDKKAIVVLYKDKKIGNINRGLVDSVHRWLDMNLIKSIVIERINGDLDHPKIYLFLKISNKKS